MADWFRRSTWAPADRADFESRLARARPGNRAQYLRIQGVHLAQAGVYQPAMELLQRVVEDYPNSLDVAVALSTRGRCLLVTGAVIEGLEVLRRCMRRERELPGVRTDAWLDFAFAVSRLRVVSCYAEAASCLDEGVAREGRPMLFPVQRFKQHAARAMLRAAGGEPEAYEEAQRALEAAALESSGLRHHPDLGLVGDSYDDVQDRLRGMVGG